MKPKSMMSAVSRIAMVALLLPVGMLAAQSADSEAVSKLLAEVKTHAAEADKDADTLESYTRSNLQYKTHATQITRVKEHVNDLIRDFNEMSLLRHLGSPWQQEAIDHINELLPQMAAHLTAMIGYMKENQSGTNLQPFRDYIHENKRLISKAHEMINDYVDYGEAKAKADALEKELQLTTPSTSGE